VQALPSSPLRAAPSRQILAIVGSDEASAARPATGADLSAVAETVSLAFHDDPTWAWAFPDAAVRQQQYAVFWRFLIAGALRYPWVLMTDGCEAAAVWIPPGGTEIAEEDEARFTAMIHELVGERAGEIEELLARFDAAHPRAEPHYYLSLLATHPSCAGRGLGMGLLAESLSRIDEERMPAYLESSNPANNGRYERHGFVAIGEFLLPGTTTPVTTMWRSAHA
jgi:ribosomal protein S18 acetylase RimI-like enzyme